MLMTRNLHSIENALQMKAISHDTVQRYFKLCLSYVEYISPSELNKETGRMMKLLCNHPNGLTREEMLMFFYEDYTISSLNKQNSLKLRLEKIIQRSRINYLKYNLTIYFSKDEKKYFLKLV